ncbi:MAG: methionyl-tRNA formyltransferase [Mariprofundaceae bacterium]|nr:methionyl-tRNA formyltransferase [Mariprofundaceae bacterium]
MMRIVFAATPGFSVPCLQALLDCSDMDVVGVVSQPDRKSGRGMRLTPSPVKKAALAAGIDVINPESLRANDAALTWLKEKHADFLVVVAFGMILPKSWLDAVSIAPVNVHASLLPRWRGAAPIERALLAGDAETGVCIMHMEEGLDTGGVYARQCLPITNTTTGSDLWISLAPMGAVLLVDTLPKIALGLACVAQNEQGMTYAKKLQNDTRILDWHIDAAALDRVVRCFSPKPGARTLVDGKWLKVIAGTVLSAVKGGLAGEIVAVHDGLDILCGDGLAYRITELQAEGKKAMPAIDFLRGSNLRAGMVLG